MEVDRNFEYLSSQSKPSNKDFVVPQEVQFQYDNRQIADDPQYSKIIRLFKHYLGSRFKIKVKQRAGFRFAFVYNNALAPSEAVYKGLDKMVIVEYCSQKGFILGIRTIIDLFEFNKGRFLPGNVLEKSVCLDFRITSTFFSLSGFGDPEFQAIYPETYVQKLCLSGIDGILMFINLFDYSETSILPELRSPNAARLIRSLQELSELLCNYGIRIFLHLNTPKIPKDHKVFKVHPELRGATCWDEHSHCLCSSKRRVIKYYQEVINNVIRKAEVGGLIFLIGGESFMHCHSRPTPRTDKGTNCAACAKKDGDTAVADFINSLVKGLDKDRRGEILVWPYSAFLWSSDRAQLNFIKQLCREVTLLSNFDSNQWISRAGTKTFVYDYSVTNVGPSDRFKKQNALLRRLKRDHWAKYESAISVEMFNMPYLPVMHKWARKAKALRDMNIKGHICNWGFFGYGYTDSIPEQIFEAYSMDPEPESSELLRAIATREYGKGHRHAVKAWEYFSESFDHYPYSGAFIGGRSYYCKGPMYIGPAHPFIFNVESRYGLSTDFLVADVMDSGGIASEEWGQGTVNRKPKYFSDLYWTQPFGAEKMATILDKMIGFWQKGETEWQNLLKMPLSASERANALEQLGIILAVGASFRTAYHLVLFYMLRDKCFYQPQTKKGFKDTIDRLKKVIAQEYNNAEQVIPFLKSDRRIGYLKYGTAYSAGMVEEKLKQLKAVMGELESFANLHGFHVYADPF